MHFLALYPIGMFIGLIFATIHKATEKHIRHPRAVVEEQGNADDVMQLLNEKCVDKAPNCNQELCQKYNISLWKKCKKTCGDCDPMMKMITRNPKREKISTG